MYYIVKKNDSEIRCETKAGAFEAYDCFGRFDVVIEQHFTDKDASGNEKKYVRVFADMARRTTKNGMKYYLRNMIKGD